MGAAPARAPARAPTSMGSPKGVPVPCTATKPTLAALRQPALRALLTSSCTRHRCEHNLPVNAQLSGVQQCGLLHDVVQMRGTI